MAETILGGKYRVLRVLGEGAMGAVFEAENVLTLKRVAVKWLKTEAYDSPLRLMREAQAAARVRHPNVVDVYDVAQEGEAVFLVMEYLEGEPLSALLARGSLPVHELVALLLPALRGLSALHKHGVIHRDLKPDNIFLARVADTEQPVPKLLDFGISKLEPRGSEQLRITSEGLAMGTPMYMSLEQLTGRDDIDGRADVYAFGVLLYEALTGQVPFDADTLSELAIKIATTEPIAPRALRPEIPGELEQVIARAMTRDRALRTASSQALLLELEPFATLPCVQAEAPASSSAPAPVDARALLQGRAGAAPAMSVEPSVAPSASWSLRLWLGALTGLLALLAIGLLTRAPARRSVEPAAATLELRPRPEPRAAAPVLDATPADRADAAVELLPSELRPGETAAPAVGRKTSARAASAARSHAELQAVSPPGAARDASPARPAEHAPDPSVTAPAARDGRKFRATSQAPRAEDF